MLATFLCTHGYQDSGRGVPKAFRQAFRVAFCVGKFWAKEKEASNASLITAKQVWLFFEQEFRGVPGEPIWLSIFCQQRRRHLF
jgi:hypothetical protein